MKALFAFAITAALASSAEAAVVTTTLEIDPAGTWKLFAQASAGDNAGIAGFVVKLDNIATAQNLAPQAFSLNTFTAMGFTTARSGQGAIAANPISAGQNTTIANSLVFDVGLQPGSIANTIPNNPTDVQPSWGYPIQLASGTFTGSTLPSFASTDVLFTVFGPSRTATDVDAATLNKVVSVVAVPEPAGFGLLAVAGAGLLRRVRRRQSVA